MKSSKINERHRSPPLVVDHSFLRGAELPEPEGGHNKTWVPGWRPLISALEPRRSARLNGLRADGGVWQPVPLRSLNPSTGWMETCPRRLSCHFCFCFLSSCRIQLLLWRRTTFYMTMLCRLSTTATIKTWCATWKERSAAREKSGAPKSGAASGARTSILLTKPSPTCASSPWFSAEQRAWTHASRRRSARSLRTKSARMWCRTSTGGSPTTTCSWRIRRYEEMQGRVCSLLHVLLLLLQHAEWREVTGGCHVFNSMVISKDWL